MTVRQLRVQVVPGADRRRLRDRRDLRVDHIEGGAFTKLNVHEGHADVEAVVAGDGVHGALGLGIPTEARARIDDGGDAEAS